MRNTTFHALLGAGLLLAAPLGGAAAELGKLTVLSAPGEPLQAQIDLTGVASGEAARLKARLASPAAYEQAHLAFPAAIQSLHLSLEVGADGAPFLRLTSPQPVGNADLGVLIQLDSGSGAQVREYSVMPAQSGSVAVPVNMPAAPASAAHPPAAPASPAVPGRVRVKNGDTLYGIARPRLAPGQSLEQLVVAIYQANPQGFSQQNMNRLVAGRVLAMPSREAVAAVKPAEALKAIREQVQSWHGYQQQIAAQVTAQAPKGHHTASQGAGGKIQSATRDLGAASPDAPKDVLHLSRGASPASGAAGEAQARQDKLASAEEEHIARGKNLQEADDRIRALKQNISEMNHLAAVKEANLANMQRQAEKARHPAPRPAGKPATHAAAQPAATPMRHKAGLAALGVAVLSLLGVVVLMVRRRREAEAPPEGSGYEAIQAAAMQPAAHPPEPPVAARDPLDQAEIYLAEQQVSQAEEILTSALTRDSSRTDILLKLLEIYAMRGNTAAYEALARQYLANHAGRKPAEWQMLCARGREIDPHNPLYREEEGGQGNGFGFAAAPAVAGLVMDPPSSALEASRPAAPLPIHAPTADAAGGLAFSLDEIPSFTDSLPAAEASAPPVASEAPVATPAAAPGLDLDFNFALDAGSPEAAPVATAKTPDYSEIDLNLDAPASVPAAGATEDVGAPSDAALFSEVATKLDLARAYIEMGDMTGAREILDEAVNEAQGDQLIEARALMERAH